MKNVTLIAITLFVSLGCAATTPERAPGAQAKQINAASLNRGFFDFEWDESTGKVFLHIEQLDTPFIYQTSLARGIGSNDIGADRGRLGDTKLVTFFRSGSKVLLIEQNTDFVARSSNAREVQAVEESFARSAIWGFTIERTDGGALVVDATDFLLRDSMSLGRWLSDMEEGNYKVDSSRSAVFLPRTRAFPDNTEFEAILTLTGTPTGKFLRTVVPDATAITVHTHHSFIRLPEPGFEPLAYDPRAGYLSPSYGGSFADYAVPIATPINAAYARRHRLKKKQPDAPVSEAVEPIVYYLDAGAPEPVRQALLDGARWWNQAFEAAGYQNAFQVTLLPDDADPMDVRYNVIQWVHRSTRGWSYGASVVDPRSGEIIKGHVSLGSLRVRQDYLLAEGLLAPYAQGDSNPALEAFALARIRQLSAHEVGHTLGLEHNFAGSVNNRASVMDYPFPFVTLDAQGRPDLSQAYDENIGAWDKRAILWGYQDFAPGVDRQAQRAEILRATLNSSLKYVADADARHVGSAHIDGNLWDNGAEPVAELDRLMTLRRRVLENFSSANIPSARPMATLEEALVPMYLLHRYQLQAAGKVLGGGYYRYDLKGDGQPGFERASADYQQRALTSLLNTLSPSSLLLPERVVALISPRPPGHPRTRESFDRKTRHLFDQFAPADAAATLALQVLLEPSRAERLHAQDAAGFGFGLSDLMKQLLDTGVSATRQSGRAGEVQRRLNNATVKALVGMTTSAAVTDGVRGVALATLMMARDAIEAQAKRNDSLWQSHDLHLMRQINKALETQAPVAPFQPVTPPPGSPIG